MRALILTAVLAAPVQAHRLTETVGVRIRVRKPAVGAQVTHGVVSGSHMKAEMPIMNEKMKAKGNAMIKKTAPLLEDFTRLA